MTRDERARESMPPLMRSIANGIDSADGQSLIRSVVVDELRPIVREALTEQALQGISDMMNLIPEAVAALKDDIQNSEDPAIRQRAYSLAVKYTMGHPAVVQPEESGSHGQMIVQFNLPRPDHVDAEVLEATDEPDRTCNMCNEAKPAAQFVANSSRCYDCQALWEQRIEAMVE